MEEDDGSQVTADLAELDAIVARLKQRLKRQGALRLVVDREGPTYASYARAVVEARARFQRFVPGNFFSDPAFDMLLDLFVATEGGGKRTFKVAALASRVPPATAARYIDMLVQGGLVLREADPDDGRRTLLSLSARALEGIRGWLATISSIPLRREWPD